MYQRFFPNAPESDSIQFAKQLPEWKLSMAKLQGHFLKHRKDGKACLQKVEDILKEADVVNEMPVAEWLERLNLIKYMAMFSKHRVYTVKEIQNFVDASGSFNESFSFKDTQDQMRLGLMVRGDPSAKEDFQYQTQQGGRRIIGKFVKNLEIREKLVESVKEDAITGFQLKDILRDNFTFETIRDAIIARQDRNEQKKLKMEDARVIAANIDMSQFKDETEEEKLARWGHPSYDIKKLLEEQDLKDSIPKLEEHKIDSELFWQLAEGEFTEKLDVKVYGQVKMLMHKIEEIKADHKKQNEEKDKLKDKLTEEDKKKIEVLGEA